MASDAWQQNSLINALLTDPKPFDFFQLVRICNQYAHDLSNKEIQFCVTPYLSFPATEISATKHREDKIKFYIMFIGLIGQSGILPEHDTETILHCLQEKNESLLAFLDIFHHRIIELFYSIWQQSRILSHQIEDQPVPTALLPFSGQFLLGGSYTIPLNLSCYYAGLFGKRSGSAEALCHLLSDYFNMPVSIFHFSGRWVTIDAEQQTQIDQQNQYNRLGCNAMVGESIWHVQNHFDLIIGPVNYQGLLELLPNGDAQTMLRKIVTAYLGTEFSFTLRVQIAKEKMPPCCLGTEIQLGWTMLMTESKPTNNILEINFDQLSTTILKRAS